jgi:hypothetical protein
VVGELVVPSSGVVVDEDSEPDSVVVEESAVAVHAERTNANRRKVVFVVCRTVSPRGLWFIQ